MTQPSNLVNVIEVEHHRYDELIAKEERLRMLEKALSEADYWNSVSQIRAIFGITQTSKKGT